MLAAKNFQSGMMTLRQIVFSSFDMHLHTDYDPQGAASVLELSRQINDAKHVVPQSPLSRWPNTFSHIFAGGYAAGYYSYKWAEVLSADVYARSRKPRSSPAACSTAPPASVIAARSCPWVVAARRWNRSWPSAAARRRSTRCCGTVA
jgi:Zn-dependent oligopeptidase